MNADDPLFARLDELLNEMSQFEAQLVDPKIAADHRRATELSRKRAAILPICRAYESYHEAIKEAQGLEQILEEESDPQLREMAHEELPDVRARGYELLEQIKGDLVTSEDRSIGSVILEIRAGVGGDEAGLWAGDLLEMYHRYADARGWSWEQLDLSTAEIGGIRQAIVRLEGEGVWQHLGYEGGTHCVKRVPATETQGRVHTSTATVAVLPEPEAVDINLDEADVRTDVTTARGPGGQNVNKVATAIKLLHVPTGIEVRMQDTKSQQQNRIKAWQVLRARLYEHHQKAVDAERAEARSKIIGSASRGERIRTYRYKDNIAVDHRINQSFPLPTILSGNLDAMVTGLIEHDKQQRLAAL
ncbi:MAG: PCRF domain-containing protein [Phycisphaeraceae bacterium]